MNRKKIKCKKKNLYCKFMKIYLKLFFKYFSEMFECTCSFCIFEWWYIVVIYFSNFVASFDTFFNFINETFKRIGWAFRFGTLESCGTILYCEFLRVWLQVRLQYLDARYNLVLSNKTCTIPIFILKRAHCISIKLPYDLK